jgi:hypothetical protein
MQILRRFAPQNDASEAVVLTESGNATNLEEPDMPRSGQGNEETRE